MAEKRGAKAPRGGESIGRRAGRNTTHQARAFEEADDAPIPPSEMEPDGTGIHEEGDGVDGYHQRTAMFDKGELLGELAELQDPVIPGTRAAVEAAQNLPKGFKLIIVAGPDIGMEWSFKGQEVTIGRGSENTIDFSDIAVSRNHVKIALEDMSYVLSDLGSNNGTLLNGAKVEREVLSSGDEIVVGARTLRYVELNEAPATAAAYPVPKPGAEPAMGRGSEIVPAGLLEEALLGGGGGVDLSDAPAEPGGSKVEKAVPAKDEAKDEGKKPSKAVVAAGAVAALLVLGFMGYTVVKKIRAAREAGRVAATRTEFLQGIELSKQLRCGDAIVLFDRVLAKRPEYTRAKEYKAHCEREIEVWGKLEQARGLIAVNKHEDALAMLAGVDADSAYDAEAERLRKRAKEARAMEKLRDARGLLDSGNDDAALDLVVAALRDAPELSSAQELRDRIEDAKRAASEKNEAPRPKAPKIPPLMQRAVGIYKDDQIAAAIDAAEAAGGPDAQVYVARMERVKSLLAELTDAHREKAAADLIKVAPEALEVDRQIAGGEGRPRERIKAFYADGLYLKGIEAYQDEDWVRAYSLLTEALKAQPGHRLAETRLAELSRRARELYYEGYVQKDVNAEETRKIFRRVKQITPPGSEYNKLASKWLAANGGG